MNVDIETMRRILELGDGFADAAQARTDGYHPQAWDWKAVTSKVRAAVGPNPRKHQFAIRNDYPNETPGGKLFAGHYYACKVCGLEVGAPDYATDCPGRLCPQCGNGINPATGTCWTNS